MLKISRDFTSVWCSIGLVIGFFSACWRQCKYFWTCLAVRAFRLSDLIFSGNYTEQDELICWLFFLRLLFMPLFQRRKQLILFQQAWKIDYMFVFKRVLNARPWHKHESKKVDKRRKRFTSMHYISEGIFKSLTLFRQSLKVAGAALQSTATKRIYFSSAWAWEWQNCV